jgi:hypothetical protein
MWNNRWHIPLIEEFVDSVPHARNLDEAIPNAQAEAIERTFV